MSVHHAQIRFYRLWTGTGFVSGGSFGCGGIFVIFNRRRWKNRVVVGEKEIVANTG